MPVVARQRVSDAGGYRYLSPRRGEMTFRLRDAAAFDDADQARVAVNEWAPGWLWWAEQNGSPFDFPDYAQELLCPGS